MVILEISSVNLYNNYYLLDKKNNKAYSLYLEFYGVDKPKVGDSLAINEKLLDKNYEGYCQPYAFILCENENKINVNNTEKIALNCGNKKYILKRIYG